MVGVMVFPCQHCHLPIFDVRFQERIKRTHNFQRSHEVPIIILFKNFTALRKIVLALLKMSALQTPFSKPQFNILIHCQIVFEF